MSQLINNSIVCYIVHAHVMCAVLVCGHRRMHEKEMCVYKVASKGGSMSRLSTYGLVLSLHPDCGRSLPPQSLCIFGEIYFGPILNFHVLCDA